MHLSFRFEYLDGSLTYREIREHECRAINSQRMLEEIIARDPTLFFNRCGIVTFDDSPLMPEEALDCELRFCCTKRIGTHATHLPFPCPYALGWPQVGVKDGLELFDTLLHQARSCSDKRIFWIGADTNPTRVALSQLAREHPDIFDVTIISWDRRDPCNQRTHGRYVSIPDHKLYKYLIDCPGYGYSARVKWLLASGRALFLVEREFGEYWHDWLKPWVHYIPVRADLSDLLTSYDTLEQNPALYAEIVASAQDFVRKELLLHSQFRHVLSSLRSSLRIPHSSTNCVSGAIESTQALPPCSRAFSSEPDLPST